MVLVFVFLNYILLTLFMNEYYLIYFLSIGLVIFGVHFYKYQVSGLSLLSSIFLIFISLFVLEYYDTSLFYLYVFFDLDKYYTFKGGEVSYILSALHSIFLFLGYNRKKYL